MRTHKGNSWSWPWGHTGEERPSKQGLLQGSQGPMVCPYSISTLTLSLVIYPPGKGLLGVEKAKMQALPRRGARPGGGGGWSTAAPGDFPVGSLHAGCWG